MTPGEQSPVLVALTDELAALRTVQESLETEHHVLVNGAAETLEQTIAAKTTALDLYSEKRQARERLTTSEALRDHIASRPDLASGERDKALGLVAQLRDTGEACHQLNQRNGRLIGPLQDRATNMLGILRSGEASVTLYGEAGHRSSDLGSRVLGTA